MPTRNEYNRRINEFYSFIDDFLNVFKGQITLDEFKKLTYKEAVLLRTTRVNRMITESNDAKSKGKDAQTALAMKRFEEHIEENM